MPKAIKVSETVPQVAPAPSVQQSAAAPIPADPAPAVPPIRKMRGAIARFKGALGTLTKRPTPDAYRAAADALANVQAVATDPAHARETYTLDGKGLSYAAVYDILTRATPTRAAILKDIILTK